MCRIGTSTPPWRFIPGVQRPGEILLRLSIAGLAPRMRTFEWQVLHRPLAIAIEERGRRVDALA